MLIGYARVSSENDRQNTDLQIDALLKEKVDRRNIFIDFASGAKTKRPNLEKALNFLQPGDCLVVWKLDRLGRSLPHLLQIFESLKKSSISFRSITEQMDTNTAGGQFLFQILGVMAEYERALARERILAGLESAKLRGISGGRPRKLDSEKLETIQELLQNGTSKAQICRTFNIPKSTLVDSLKRLGF